jgi:hypothetical protein
VSVPRSPVLDGWARISTMVAVFWQARFGRKAGGAVDGGDAAARETGGQIVLLERIAVAAPRLRCGGGSPGTIFHRLCCSIAGQSEHHPACQGAERRSTCSPPNASRHFAAPLRRRKACPGQICRIAGGDAEDGLSFENGQHGHWRSERFRALARIGTGAAVLTKVGATPPGKAALPLRAVRAVGATVAGRPVSARRCCGEGL